MGIASQSRELVKAARIARRTHQGSRRLRLRLLRRYRGVVWRSVAPRPRGYARHGRRDDPDEHRDQLPTLQLVAQNEIRRGLGASRGLAWRVVRSGEGAKAGTKEASRKSEHTKEKRLTSETV